MQYAHDKKMAKAHAAAALRSIERYDLAATPDIYELWYSYNAGENFEVRRAVDAMLAANSVNAERCRDLHRRLLSDQRSEEAVRRAGDQVTTTLKNVSGMVSEVKSATTSFSDRLGSMSTRANTINEPSELRAVLSDMVADTQRMIEHNKALENTLERSTAVMAELQRDLDLVRLEATTDGLTGLANRKSFDMALGAMAQEAKAEGKVFTLLMVDIDHFKTFNDNFGHQVGDQVLRLVSRTLTDGVKGRDIAARYGGEEFAIILPDTPLHLGVHVANSLRNAVATKEVVNRNTSEKLGRITMSVGVAEFIDNEHVNELIERADAALYTAKHNGRNQVAAAPTPSRSR